LALNLDLLMQKSQAVNQLPENQRLEAKLQAKARRNMYHAMHQNQLKPKKTLKKQVNVRHKHAPKTLELNIKIKRKI